VFSTDALLPLTFKAVKPHASPLLRNMGGAGLASRVPAATRLSV
jgi:hypothetical protein